MRRLNSCIIACADQHEVPAGGALAVDRELFAQAVTERLASHPRIRVIREEVTEIPAGSRRHRHGTARPATPWRPKIKELTGSEDLYFYDAAAPIVTAESVDMSKGFWGARWGRGGDDYFNCALDKDEYEAFYEALVAAEVHEGHIKEELKFFEGCVPIEELARRGKRHDALRARCGRWASSTRGRGSGRTPSCSCGRKTSAPPCSTWSVFRRGSSGASKRESSASSRR